MVNRDQGRFVNYGIHEKDQTIFEQVKNVMDRVHSEFGYGLHAMRKGKMEKNKRVCEELETFSTRKRPKT